MADPQHSVNAGRGGSGAGRERGGWWSGSSLLSASSALNFRSPLFRGSKGASELLGLPQALKDPLSGVASVYMEQCDAMRSRLVTMQRENRRETLHLTAAIIRLAARGRKINKKTNSLCYSEEQQQSFGGGVNLMGPVSHPIPWPAQPLPCQRDALKRSYSD